MTLGNQLYQKARYKFLNAIPTLFVTAATNATPIVVTTSAVHGLVDGDQIAILGALGNLAANGKFFAKRTSYSSTTFGLYSDSGLTTAVAGTGVWTSGGNVLL